MSRGSQMPPLLGRLAALTDLARLRILRLLAAGELSVGELARALQLPQSTVSRHLKILADDGWVTSRASGTSRFYRMAASLEPAALELWALVRPDVAAARLTEVDDERARAVLLERKLGLAVGAARGDVLGPPLGNAPLQWREWVERDLVDELVINQNSSRCPSMWHDLWPMHRGSGYLQNYLDGSGLPPLGEHVKDVYAKVFAGNRAKLYIARQWDHRDEATEAALSALPAVNGLVFSSFRHDNPGPIARGDWQA